MVIFIEFLNTRKSYRYDHENRLTQVLERLLSVEETNVGERLIVLRDTLQEQDSRSFGGVRVQSPSIYREPREEVIADYVYDHRSRRVGRSHLRPLRLREVQNEASIVSFSGGNSIIEQDIPSFADYLGKKSAGNSDEASVEYTRGSDYGGGIGGILYTLRSGAPSFNFYNSRGDVVSKVDYAGTLTWQASYEAFGKRTQEAGETEDVQKANTKEEDPTGLLNEGMRYRDLETGTFITRDPAGFVDGPNVYTYVKQNPWTFYDPLGLKSEWHHRYPQEYLTEFKKMGIDIHKAESGIILKQTDHKHLHGRGYNEAWKKHFDHMNRDTSLTQSARKARTESFLKSLEKKPKFKSVLRRGAPVPLGMKWNKEYQKIGKEGRANMFKEVWGNAKGGKALRYLGNAAKVGGKVFKVAGFAMIPSQYAQGAEYASDVYAAGETMQEVAGLAQAILPVGPSDATATWDMKQSDVAKEGRRLNQTTGAERWRVAAERVANPASPRWIPTQIVRGGWELATQ